MIAKYFGGIFNFIAVWANDGQHMPVYYGQLTSSPVVTDARHVTMTASTHLKFLCDYITYWGYINSPGDAIMDIGALSLWTIFIVLGIIGFASLKKD